MTCAACSNSVELALKSVDGVAGATVALLQNKAEVLYNPNLVKVCLRLIRVLSIYAFPFLLVVFFRGNFCLIGLLKNYVIIFFRGKTLVLTFKLCISEIAL